MSTPEPKRDTRPTSESKPPASSNPQPASHSTPQTTRPSPPAITPAPLGTLPNGTGEGTPTSVNGGGQGLSAALAEAPEHRGSKDRSNAIDRQLEDDSKKFKKECKILLLGTWSMSTIDKDTDIPGSGESGKSTIVKQMKIIHQSGYQKDELLAFRMIMCVATY